MLGVTNRSSFFCMVTGLSLIAGSGIVYWYSRKYARKEKPSTDKTNDKMEPSVHERYINKYYDKFNKLEDADIEESVVKGLKSSILYEATPRGGVIMFYDFEKESFCYYSDTKDVPYLFLETAARRYVTINKCKQVYVDMKEQLLVANNMNDNKNTGVGLDTVDGARSGLNKSEPFASFKSYNRKGTGGTKNTNLNKKFILRQNANRYSYMGKIKDFQMTNNAEYNKIKDPVTTMDYNTFKRTILSAK